MMLRKYFEGLSQNTLFIALASLFSDISTEMVYPLLPIYLTENLKASGGVVGIIEGISSAVQNIIQGFSGTLSDWWQKRKSIALFGYVLSALSKPLIGLATTWSAVLGARFSDRLGAGSRSAPRDALLASSVSESNKGKAFGLEGFGDNLGAFLGPLVAIWLFFYVQMDIRSVFYWAVIPGLLAVLMVALVKERRGVRKVVKPVAFNRRAYPWIYWRYLMVTAIFGLGNSSNSFLILHIKDSGLSLMGTIWVYALFNLVAALVSYPAGSLSDAWGRKPLLLFSFAIFFITYIGFAFISNVVLIGGLLVLYGLFQGIFRSVGKAFALDFVPDGLRAGGVGWYATTVGLSGMIASMLGGLLWDKISHEAVFIYGALFALIGTITLLVLIPNRTNA